MYAIQNVKTGEFVYGTDYRYSPHRQRTSKNQMVTFMDLVSCQLDFLHRRRGKNYKIVVLKTIEVKRILEPPRSYEDVKIGKLSETD